MTASRKALYIAALLIGVSFAWAERDRPRKNVFVQDGLEIREHRDAQHKLHGRWEHWQGAVLHEEGEAHHGALIWRKCYYPSGKIEWDYSESRNHDMVVRHYAEDGTPLN